MKPLVVLVITDLLFGYKDKSEDTIPNTVSPGVVGTYSKTYTLEEFEVFRFVFPERKIFQQTVTVVITQTEKGEYNLDVTLFGTVKNDKDPNIRKYCLWYFQQISPSENLGRNQKSV